MSASPSLDHEAAGRSSSIDLLTPGSEVSTRAVAFLFEELEKRDLPAEKLLDGSGFTLAQIHDKHGRLDWQGVCRLMANAGQVWTDEEMIELGENLISSPWFRPFTLPMRMLFSATDIYRKLAAPLGPPAQMFSCLTTELVEHTDHRLLLRVVVREGYAKCREVHLVTQGSLIASPKLLGLSCSKVEMEELERGALYTIDVPRGGAWLAAARRLISAPLTARTAVTELDNASEKLHQRNLELEAEITERKRAEQALEQLVAQLEAKNQELESFTYTVSHDLKSPLITILGFLGFLEKRLGEDRDRVGKEIDRIRVAANGMNQLLVDLLELSRVGRFAAAAEAVSLDAVTRKISEGLRARASRDGARIEIELVPELATVWADPGRVEQALQNLLDNAYRFRQPGDAAYIEVSTTEKNDEVTVRVRDQGIGIALEHQERIFHLFEQLDPGRGGTGVGLAVVAKIAEVHGGRTWLESAGEGHGSSFFLSLPKAPRLSKTLGDNRGGSP